MLRTLPRLAETVALRYLVAFRVAWRAVGDPAVQDAQVLAEQDRVGGLPGDAGGSGDGEADVGGAQRRCVVDAVAEVADDVPAGAQRPHDAGLVQRIGLGEDRGAGGEGGEGMVAELGGAGAGDRFPGRDAGGLAEGDGGSGLVAGEDDGADALAGEALDCLCRAGFWRVGEAEESGQRQPGLPPGARFAAGFFADGAVGDREQPHAVVPQLLGDLAGLGTEGAAEGLLAAGEPHGRAGVQDGGDGALGDHQARAGAGVEDDAGAAAGEVKADLAGLVVLGLSNLTVQRLAGAEDRGVQGGAVPRR